MKSKIDIRAPQKGDSVFSTDKWLSVPLETTFEFFSDARNLEEITPPFLKFRIVTPAPIEMEPGALIDYQLKLRGIPLRWRTEIVDWDPPRGFTDVQLRGPYRKWVHRHDFKEENGGTLVSDTVHYRVPGGSLADRMFVRKDLIRIFAYRHTKIEVLLRSFQNF